MRDHVYNINRGDGFREPPHWTRALYEFTKYDLSKSGEIKEWHEVSGSLLSDLKCLLIPFLFQGFDNAIFASSIRANEKPRIVKYALIGTSEAKKTWYSHEMLGRMRSAQLSIFHHFFPSHDELDIQAAEEVLYDKNGDVDHDLYCESYRPKIHDFMKTHHKFLIETILNNQLHADLHAKNKLAPGVERMGVAYPDEERGEKEVVVLGSSGDKLCEFREVMRETEEDVKPTLHMTNFSLDQMAKVLKNTEIKIQELRELLPDRAVEEVNTADELEEDESITDPSITVAAPSNASKKKSIGVRARQQVKKKKAKLIEEAKSIEEAKPIEETESIAETKSIDNTKLIDNIKLIDDTTSIEDTKPIDDTNFDTAKSFEEAVVNEEAEYLEMVNAKPEPEQTNDSEEEAELPAPFHFSPSEFDSSSVGTEAIVPQNYPSGLGEGEWTTVSTKKDKVRGKGKGKEPMTALPVAEVRELCCCPPQLNHSSVFYFFT